MRSQAERPQERFSLIRAFLRDLDDLVARPAPTPDTVQSVKNRLADLIRQSPTLPDPVKLSSASCYSRHLLYADPEGRYEIVVMVWGPGQSTPIHDHAGIWCVEGVVEGVIDVTRYDLVKMVGTAARMQTTEVIHAGLGQCGALIPPVEYHKISNPYERPAFTMHVYGGQMRSCRIFTQRDDGDYDISDKELGFSSPRPALAPLPS